MSALTTIPYQTAGTRAGSPDRMVYAVVGFDGSASSLRALDAAAWLLNDRPGGMEIVYVAHVPVVAAVGLSGEASAEVLQGLDDATRDLSEMARARLRATHLRAAAQRWHFQRRDGAIADNLIAVADELRLQHGPDVTVFLVVGRSEHGYHRVFGSVPGALERHVHYPVLVIP
ncbi:MAG TPA: universal stress protein [Trebonia sp.]|jgi:nucleotide-binding universal stress UspA family protein|nr:universal stress protein [Trebonia sp.]